jgi:syntaxin-binding protein 1
MWLSLKEKHKGWMVCVVDDSAMRVMSSVMGMYDLMEQHVSLVEGLDKKRAPFTDLGVIYVCAPTVDNVEKIVNDFLPTDGKKQPLYGSAVFLYFLSSVPKEVLSKIKMCKTLVKRLKALGEINVDFLAKQNRAFHFDMVRSLPDLYRREGVFTLTHNSIVEKLVTLCATLNEYPHVRYPVTCPLAQNLAETFQSKMNEFVASAPNWWYYGMSGHMERDRSSLLLLDRSFDPLTPLMHEFTYQAMVNDLLDIDDDKISYKADVVKGEEEGEAHVESMAKDVLLNENDNLWVELRGRHIADVIQTLSNRIKEVVNSNSSAKLAAGDGASLSLSQMATALKALPEYQEIMSKLSQHMHISHQCMSVFNKQGLLELADLEQTLATGVDDDRRNVRINDMIDRVEQLLPDMEPFQALRLIAVFLASQEGGTPEPAQNRLYAAANLSQEYERGLQNFQKLGITIDQGFQSNANRMKNMFG